MENFTRQLERPSTMMPFSLLLLRGAGGLPVWTALASSAAWAAFSMAAARLICWSSSRMRLTAFSAV